VIKASQNKILSTTGQILAIIPDRVSTSEGLH